MQPVVRPLASYKPAGHRADVKTAMNDTIPCYEVAPDGFTGKSEAALLVVHDIFGWGHMNNFQVSRTLRGGRMARESRGRNEPRAVRVGSLRPRVERATARSRTTFVEARPWLLDRSSITLSSGARVRSEATFERARESSWSSRTCEAREPSDFGRSPITLTRDQSSISYWTLSNDQLVGRVD
jgi:hypothetical protein